MIIWSWAWSRLRNSSCVVAISAVTRSSDWTSVSSHMHRHRFIPCGMIWRSYRGLAKPVHWTIFLPELTPASAFLQMRKATGVLVIIQKRGASETKFHHQVGIEILHAAWLPTQAVNWASLVSLLAEESNYDRSNGFWTVYIVLYTLFFSLAFLACK